MAGYPFQKGDRVLVDGGEGIVSAVEHAVATVVVKDGARKRFMRVDVEHLMPVGSRTASGRGDGVVAALNPEVVLPARERVDLGALFLPGVRFVRRNGDEVKLYRKALGTLDLDGTLFVADPQLLAHAPASTLSLSGEHGRVECVVDPAAQLHCAARLVWLDGPIDGWEDATFDGGGNVFPVDAGRACFAVKPDTGRMRHIGFPSGYGDGGYPVYLGTQRGRPACLLIDFGVLYEPVDVALEFGEFRHLRKGRLAHPVLEQANITAELENFETRTVFEITRRGDEPALEFSRTLTGPNGERVGSWGELRKNSFTLHLREPPPPGSVLGLHVRTRAPLRASR